MLVAERKFNGEIILQDGFNSVERVFPNAKTLNDSHLEQKMFGLVDHKTLPSIQNFAGIAFNIFHKAQHSSSKLNNSNREEFDSEANKECRDFRPKLYS